MNDTTLQRMYRHHHVPWSPSRRTFAPETSKNRGFAVMHSAAEPRFYCKRDFVHGDTYCVHADHVVWRVRLADDILVFTMMTGRMTSASRKSPVEEGQHRGDQQDDDQRVPSSGRATANGSAESPEIMKTAAFLGPLVSRRLLTLHGRMRCLLGAAGPLKCQKVSSRPVTVLGSIAITSGR